MKIERISIINFKRITSLTVALGDITYLVGGNNSGKSSVLQAVHMAGDFQKLGNSGPYENPQGGSRGVVEFFGKTTDGADASYKVEIYKARNYHNVGVNRTGVYPGFGQFICDPTNLFSVSSLCGIPDNPGT